MKYILKTTNIFLWLALLYFLFLIFSFSLDASSYGVDIAWKSTLSDLKIFLGPFFSPLIWTSNPNTTVYNFIINISVFYAIFVVSFWMKSKNKLLGIVCIVFSTLLIVFWYYVYFLSNIVI